jgi:hypothetical protein
MRSPLPLLALCALAGCTTYGVATVSSPPIAAFGPSARPDAATICLYRPTHVGSALTIPVRDNGQLVGVTHAYTYFCWLAEPGRHRIAVGGGSDADDRVFDFLAGERLQLQHEINFGTDTLRIVAEDEARKFAEECAYAVVVSAPPDDGVPPATRVVRAQAN